MASTSEVTQNRAMNSIGKLEEFDETRDDWTAYIERVEQYFLANDVADDKRGYLSPKPLLIAERFRFHKRDQRDDENINTYVAEIKKLSKHCEFGTALNDSLRGRFVCGLYNESIQKRLLVETSLTFEKALKLAVAMETAIKDSLELRGKAKTIPPVNSIREVPMQHKCYRCGKEGHEPQECYFKDQYCRNCGQRVI
ncbi:oocyte zinc finger 6-like [Paramuricea clavata]|uniref:Oocyte zinc finger 6-like n=1 Tax=Paramuricea clavata TaxID=317549 RepID=A0A7D9DFL2_PARCT|nr:oocyte zinc finger 6-like [Paramuricea clavata]